MDTRPSVSQTAGLVRWRLPDAPISSCCHLLSLVDRIINYISITCHSMYEASGGLSVGENGAGWTAVRRSRRRGKTIFQAKSEQLDLSSNLLPGLTAGCYSGQLCDAVEFWCCFSAVTCVAAQIILKWCDGFCSESSTDAVKRREDNHEWSERWLDDVIGLQREERSHRENREMNESELGRKSGGVTKEMKGSCAFHRGPKGWQAPESHLRRVCVCVCPSVWFCD